MTQQHFTIFGGSFVREAHGFDLPPRRRQPLAIWGFVLGSLLIGVTAVATATVTVAHAGIY